MQTLEHIAEDTMLQFPAGLEPFAFVVVTPGVCIVEDGPVAEDALAMQGADEKEIPGAPLSGSDFPMAPYCWDLRPLAKFLEKRRGIKLYAENDANSALLGEKYFGKARGLDDAALYTIGKGIGSAVIVDGKLIRRYMGSSIGVGHMSINYKGPSCTCGSNGCLELYAVTDVWEKRLAKYPEYADKTNRLAALFADAARGDKTARKRLHTYSHFAALGAVMLTKLFSPEKIIVTTNEADFIYLRPVIACIRKMLSKQIFFTRKQGVAVEESSLRKHGVLLGAAAAAVERTV
jgi:glucokinase